VVLSNQSFAKLILAGRSQAVQFDLRACLLSSVQIAKQNGEAATQQTLPDIGKLLRPGSLVPLFSRNSTVPIEWSLTPDSGQPASRKDAEF
jgi:hypothetical protein